VRADGLHHGHLGSAGSRAGHDVVLEQLLQLLLLGTGRGKALAAQRFVRVQAPV
jgi:hypothetical protein